MFDMFEFVAQGVVTVLFIVFVAVVTFCLWGLWQVSTAIRTARLSTRQIREQFRAKELDREELYKIIAYNELRGNQKSADYWQEILDRKYPHG